MICVDCFENEGLRLSAMAEVHNGIRVRCARCGKTSYVLSPADLERLCYSFFVRGSVPPYQAFGTPILKVSDARDRTDQVRPAGTLHHDFELLRSEVQFSLFYYGPPEWRVGYTEPHEALEAGGKEAEPVLARLLEIAPEVELPIGFTAYRMRLGDVATDASAFDPPPRKLQRYGRFDSPTLDVLYVSPDIETCLHECRVTVIDEIVLATLKTTTPLRLKDFTGEIRDPAAVTPFENLSVMLTHLFYSGSEEYECCRKIAAAIRAAGYDGFVYPSYFSFVRSGSSVNVALFGRPLENGAAVLQSLNRLCLRRVAYEYEFGPALAEVTA